MVNDILIVVQHSQPAFMELVNFDDPSKFCEEDNDSLKLRPKTPQIDVE